MQPPTELPFVVKGTHVSGGGHSASDVHMVISVARQDPTAQWVPLKLVAKPPQLGLAPATSVPGPQQL